jgi:hypothetical protein
VGHQQSAVGATAIPVGSDGRVRREVDLGTEKCPSGGLEKWGDI